jgi:hypothetical protein
MENGFGYIKCGEVLVWLRECEVDREGLVPGTCWLVIWLIGWLVVWLVGWLVCCWFVGWLVS